MVLLSQSNDPLADHLNGRLGFDGQLLPSVAGLDGRQELLVVLARHLLVLPVEHLYWTFLLELSLTRLMTFQ